MTRKKGVALIICLTLIISMALPGTLAFPAIRLPRMKI